MSPMVFKAAALEPRNGGKTAPIPRRFSSLPSNGFGLLSRPKVITAEIFSASQRGFTLLEMVLVLFIMGLMASLSLMFIDNEDNQLRYQETLQKLEALQAGSINVVQYNDDFIFSGFIADNGVLPTTVDEYINLPSNWATRQLFNADNPVKYRISQSDSPDDLPGVNLFKGYRGAYIRSGIDSSGNYQTGWGHNFSVQTASNDLQFSYDESLINDAEYNALTNVREISAEQWSIALSELDNLQLTNTRGSDISGEDYKVALVVFNNKNTSDAVEYWNTYHIEINVTLNDGDTASFPLTSWKNDNDIDISTTTRIPAGQHPVLIVLSSTHNDPKGQSVITAIPGYSPQPVIKLDITS